MQKYSCNFDTILTHIFYTASGRIKAVSLSRLCPNEGELMHRETSTCYPKETKGPCPNNLVLLGESGRSQHGECSCPYNLFNRTLLYDKATEECYFVFTQVYLHTFFTQLPVDSDNQG